MERAEVIQSIRDTGKIPAKEICPFRADCAIAQGNGCRHFGMSHTVPYSCGAARSFPEILRGDK